MSRSNSKSYVGTLAASALIVAGLIGTIVDNNGKAGLALFVAGAAAVVFVIARQVVRQLERANVRLPKLAARGSGSKIVGARTIAAAVVAMGVLLSATNVFKANDDDAISRALNNGAWYGFLLLAIAVVAVTAATAGRWVMSKPAEATER